MGKKTRIGILGTGGVGGYFGGLLAEQYHDSKEVEIIFIARPATGITIRENGLQLITPEGEKTINATIAINATEAGPLDVLICATKSYDLEEALAPLNGSINKNTLILPLLNGVDAKDIIHALYPENEVLDGCVYINARRIAPGVIRKIAVIEKLYFGTKSTSTHDLNHLQQIFKTAGIDSTLSDDIETDIWIKYIFITGLATITTYYNLNIHKVLADEAMKDTLYQLLMEASLVAKAHKISLADDIVEQTIKKFYNLPPDAISSMHSDYLNGNKTEYRSLTKYIADLGDKLGIDTPVYDMIVADFETRNS